jgi:hypothetical protein
MSIKYYNESKVKAFNLQGTIERVVRLSGFLEAPANRIYGMSTNSIDLFQGDSRILRVSVKDQDMNAVNLNGGYAILYISERSKSTSYLIRKSTANFSQGAITDPANGEVSLYLTSADTASLPAGQYFYLIHVYLATGDKYTVLKGLINISFDIGVQPLPPPDPSTSVNIVDLSSGVSSYQIDFDLNCLVIGPSLVSPSGSSENIYVTNIVYTAGQATVYFSTSIPEEGWKLSYLLVTAV